MGKNYIKEDLNPKGNYTSDYVIRAIAKATGKSWEEVFKRVGFRV